MVEGSQAALIGSAATVDFFGVIVPVGVEIDLVTNPGIGRFGRLGGGMRSAETQPGGQRVGHEIAPPVKALVVVPGHLEAGGAVVALAHDVVVGKRIAADVVLKRTVRGERDLLLELLVAVQNGLVRRHMVGFHHLHLE